MGGGARSRRRDPDRSPVGEGFSRVYVAKSPYAKREKPVTRAVFGRDSGPSAPEWCATRNDCRPPATARCPRGSTTPARRPREPSPGAAPRHSRRSGSSASASPHASMPSSRAIRRTRSMWVRSDTKTALCDAAVAEHRRRPSGATRAWSGRGPRRGSRLPARPSTIAYRRPASASVVLSPGSLAAGHDERRGEALLDTGRSRGRGGPGRSATGRPLYWAAPRTTIASAGRPLVLVALVPDPPRRVGEDDERAGRHGKRETA